MEETRYGFKRRTGAGESTVTGLGSGETGEGEDGKSGDGGTHFAVRCVERVWGEGGKLVESKE